MRTLHKIAVAAALAFSSVGGANAALMGGPVGFAFGGSTTYTYIGTSTSPFTLAGGGTLTLASSSFADSFGTATVNHTDLATVFTNADAVGTSRSISPGYSPFLLYFRSTGSSSAANCSPATGADCPTTLFTDGTNIGGTDGGQASLAIYRAASTGTYALFFDDGGPSGCVNNGGSSVACTSPAARFIADDNDFNDLVVTYTPAAVPEPISLALLGSGLIAFGATRARRDER